MPRSGPGHYQELRTQSGSHIRMTRTQPLKPLSLPAQMHSSGNLDSRAELDFKLRPPNMGDEYTNQHLNRHTKHQPLHTDVAQSHGALWRKAEQGPLNHTWEWPQLRGSSQRRRLSGHTMPANTWVKGGNELHRCWREPWKGREHAAGGSWQCPEMALNTPAVM